MLDNDKLFRVISDFLSYIKGEKEDVNKENTNKEGDKSIKKISIPKPVQLYARLISKTRHVHTEAIAKHCDVFKKYFESNAPGILAKDLSKFSDKCIRYSDRIFIDLDYVFKNADSLGGQEKIWIELTKLLAYFVPASGAKNVLKNIKETMTNSKGKEGKLISNLIQKVESKMGGNDDPMASFGEMVKGGEMKNIIQDVVGGLSDGSLDIGGIFNELQGLISENMDSGDPTSQMFSGIIGNLGAQFGNIQNQDDDNNDEAICNATVQEVD